MVLAIVASAASAMPTPAQAADREGLYNECNGFKRMIERPTGEVLALVGFGQCDAYGESGQPVLVQFESDGGLDQSFGEEGFVYPSSTSNGIDLFLRSDGSSILVQEKGISAYGETGAPVASFGNSGVVSFDSVSDAPDPVTSAALQADDKVLVAGTTGAGEPVPASPILKRFTTAGEPDQSFGESGTVVVPLPEPPGGGDPVWLPRGLIATGPNGQIFLASWFKSDEPVEPQANEWETAVIRLEADGGTDSTYGTEGNGMARLGHWEYDTGWSGTLLKAESDGTLHLVASVSGMELKPYSGFSHFVFSPDGVDIDRFSQPFRPTAFASNFDTLITGIFDGPYSSGDPFFRFSRRLPGPDDESRQISNFSALVGTGGSRSQMAVESSSGGYFVGGRAESEQCLDGSTPRDCVSSLVLARLDADGELVESFGQDRGVTTVPRIHCPLGTSSEQMLEATARFRCRLELPPYGFRSSFSKGRSRKPGLSFVLGRLPSVEDPYASTGSVRIRLPKAINAKRGIAQKGTVVKVEYPANLECYGECVPKKPEVSYAGRSIMVDLESLEGAEPFRVTVRVKHGYLRKIAKRNWGRPLKFQAGVFYSSFDNFESADGSREFLRQQDTSTRIKKPRRAGRR